jgi:hypothetical protein
MTDASDLENEFDLTEERHSALAQCLANEDDGNENEWEMLLERARERTRRTLPHLHNDSGYQMQENDMLWEIGCKVRFYSWDWMCLIKSRLAGGIRGNCCIQNYEQISASDNA